MEGGFGERGERVRTQRAQGNVAVLEVDSARVGVGIHFAASCTVQPGVCFHSNLCNRLVFLSIQKPLYSSEWECTERDGDLQELKRETNGNQNPMIFTTKITCILGE